MRYLVTHQACDCVDRQPLVTPAAWEVGLYCWGRDVTQHIVYEGECPYFFFLGECTGIQAVLRWYPAAVVRRVVPLVIPVRNLRQHGVRYVGRGDEEVVCQIGSAPRPGSSPPGG